MKKINLIEMQRALQKNTMEEAAKLRQIPTVNRRSTDGQSQRRADDKGRTTINTLLFREGLGLGFLRYVAMIFAVLVMSVANIGMAWGANTPAAAGTYTLTSSNKPGNENKFYKLGNGVYIHRRNNSSQDNNGLKAKSDNTNGIAVYVNSSMNLSCSIYKASSKAAQTVGINVYTLSNGSTTFDNFESGTDNTTTVSVTLSASATYTTSVSFAAVGSNTTETKSSSNITLAAGYYYIVPAETTSEGKTYLKSITLAAAGCTAPTNVTVSSPLGSTGWAYIKGETIQLHANVTGGSGTPHYQWQKQVGTWQDIDGAPDDDDYEIENCTADNSGSYRCIVSTGATCSYTSDPFNVKVFRIQTKLGGDYTFHDMTIINRTEGYVQGYIHLEENADYAFKVHDGHDGWGNNTDTQMTSGNCTNWGMYTNNANYLGLRTTFTDNYLFTWKFASASNNNTISVTYPTHNQAANKYIYFDNSVTQWSNIVYRIGHSDYNNNSTEDGKTPVSKVPGTANLYKATTMEWGSFLAWHLADNTAWSGSNSIYNLTHSQATDIANYLDWQKYEVTGDITLTPTTNDGGSPKKWSVDKTDGMKTQNVSITAPSNGTLTVNYVDVSGAGQAFNSGNRDLAHTCIITVTAVPSTGYAEPANVSINGASYGNRDPYTITGTTVVAATFSPQTYSITYKDQGNVAFSGEHAAGHPTTHTYGSATTLKTATKTGYTFGGWYTSSDCSTGLVTSLGATAYTADITLYAKWTEAASQTALAMNTLYKVPDMIPSGKSLTSSDQFFDGLSANTKFELIGSGSGSTTPKVNNNSSNNKTIDDITFDDGSMWFKGNATLSSNIPTTFGLSFIVPSAGKLYLYFSGTSTNIKLAKSGETGNKPTLTDGYAAVDVTAGTYYLYGTGTTAPYCFYGLKLCSTYSVSISTDGVTKETGATGTGKAIQGKNYVATFTANSGYTLPDDATVTIGGVAQTKGTGYTWTISDGTATLTVPGAKVTGNIAITVEGEEEAPVGATVEWGDWGTAAFPAGSSTLSGITFTEALTYCPHSGWNVGGGVRSSECIFESDEGQYAYITLSSGVLASVSASVWNNGGDVSIDFCSSSSYDANYLISTATFTSHGQNEHIYSTINAPAGAKSARLYSDGEAVMISLRVTSSAGCASPETATFAKGAATSGSVGSIEACAGSEFTMPGQETMSYPYYMFTGWKLNNAGDLITAGTSYTMPAGGASFTAQWTEDVTTLRIPETSVLNYANKTGGSSDTRDFYDETCIDLYTTHNVEWEAYITPGSYQISMKYGAPYWGIRGTFSIIDPSGVESPRVFYTQTDETNGGSPIYRNPTVTYDLSGITPGKRYKVKIEHDWSGSYLSIAHIEFTPLGTNHDITFAKGNVAVTGTLPTATSCAEGGTYTLPGKGDLAWTGHVFAGWSDGVNTYAEGASYTMPDDDVTFTATWNEVVVPTITNLAIDPSSTPTSVVLNWNIPGICDLSNPATPLVKQTGTTTSADYSSVNDDVTVVGTMPQYEQFGVGFTIPATTGIEWISFDYKGTIASGDGLWGGVCDASHAYWQFDDDPMEDIIPTGSWQNTGHRVINRIFWNDGSVTPPMAQSVSQVAIYDNTGKSGGSSGTFYVRNVRYHTAGMIDIDHVVLMRKEGSAASSPSDGAATQLYSGTASHYTDSPVDAGTTYYYTIFAVHADGTLSASVTVVREAAGHTVTYNYNGATGGASPASETGASVTLPTPTRTGYELDGWYATDGTEAGDGGDTYEPEADITLYAKWYATCAAGGSTDVYTGENVAKGSTTASGWTINSSSSMVLASGSGDYSYCYHADGNSGAYVQFDGSASLASGDQIKIQWTHTSNNRDLALTINGSSASLTSGGHITTANTLMEAVYDVTSTLSLTSIKLNSGGASGCKIFQVTLVTATGGTCFHVTYDGNGATSGFVNDTTAYKSGDEVTVLANGGRYPYVNGVLAIKGWADTKVKAGAGTVDYAPGATFTITADKTLFAVWSSDYTITYNLNGASWAGGYSAPAQYTYGTGATLPIASNMSNPGYAFGGWYANSDLSTGGVVTEIGTSESGAKEFWAKWTEDTYSITYNKNDEGATGSTAATEGHYVTVADCGFELAGHLFVEWNTAEDGTGESYNAGEDIELTDNMTLYAQWASNYTISWGNVQIGGAGATVTPNIGGGNYTITANTGSWTGSLDASMISSETSGVTITNVAVNNGGSPRTITVTFAVGAEVVGESIGLTLSVPAAGGYSAKSDTHPIAIDRCTGSGGGSDGVLFSAEFKDSGLGTNNVCDAANDPYTFTTAELKSAPTGGSIKAYTTSNLSHMKFATNAISIAGSDGVIRIDLDNAIAANDLFEYINVNSSTSSAYLRHTSPTTTTDQIALTAYNNKEVKVRLASGFVGEETLYLVRNSNDFKLHKAAVVRPAFMMLLRDDTPTSDTNLSGTDVELTTSTYLATIQGGRAYFTSPSSGNLKIKRSSSKNYINFNSQAGYVKVVLNEALQEGDVIGFDSYNTNELALTITATRSTSIHTTNQLYTVGESSPLNGQTTFYIWQNSGTSDYLRGLQIARSGIAGGSGGTDKITPTLTWDPALNTDGDWDNVNNRLNKETGDADFTFVAVQDKNSLGAITYSSSNTGVATVTAGGTVHIAGTAGEATITATMAASGCYKEASISYNIHVEDNCDDTPGKVMAYDLGCDGTLLVVVLYDGMDPEAVGYQWYKDGVSLGEGYKAQRCTVTVAGEYYVVVDNTAAGERHCAMASENTVEVEAREGITAEKIVDSWYVKNGRRTPDVELVQTTGATGFIVETGGSVIWNSDGTDTDGFGGCGFHLGENGIIYLNGQADDHSAPSGLTGATDVTLTITAKGCGSDADPLEITIHCQAATDRKSIAFVVDGTEKGTFDQPNADHSTNSALYQFLDYTLSGGSGQFDLTAQNIYSSVDEKEIREHFSQFDGIIITDDPNTGKKKDGKSYVNAFGTMIDVRPILTMEAFVSKLANWKAKGVNGNPESPSPRQYAMTLQCKDHEIFFGIESTSPNVEHEEIDGVDYWTVTMVDKTKSPYSGKSDTEDTDGTPALQGFSASDVSGLLLLGEIMNGDKIMYTGVERQEEPAARLMLLGIQNKALPNALTTEGKTIIENAVTYLLKTNMEEVDDCSNYFIGGGGDNNWSTDANWFKGKAPNSPMIRARILAPCEVNTTVHAAHIDIVTSGKSGKKAGDMTGQLTIKPNGAVIVSGEIRSAEAPYFNKSDLKPTEEEDLKIETSADGQGALILNNDAGDTKATVEYYSLGKIDGGAYQFQYFASPMEYLEINPAFAGAGIYTYAWNEAVADGWERRAYYADVLGFEGLAITTKRDYPSTYTMKGWLASTADVDIPLTHTDAGAQGQNLIGNSWTAPINIASLVEAFDDDDNVTKTVNIYNSGNDEYPGIGAAGTWTEVPISVAGWDDWTGLKVIPAMQAFRIDVTSETKLSLNYKKMVRQTESSSLNEPLKAPSRRSNVNGASLMRIRLESGMAYTDLFLIEGGQFSEAFDNGYEATFIAGEENTVQFYAMNGEEKMAVLATDELEGTPVGFVPGRATAYTISFSGEGKGYYFNDVKTHTSTLISEENTYSFDYEAGDDANRFYISATPFAAPSIATGVTNLDAAAPKVQKIIYNDKLYILRGGKVFSADGQLVK